MRRPFVIDCDTGTDDAIMLAAAVGCGDIDIKAVTCVNGNVPEDMVARNNLSLLEYFRCDIPVIRGAGRAISGEVRHEDYCHGETGLGSLVIPDAAASHFAEGIASEEIYRIAKEAGGNLEILATGPMTNLALSIINHPDIAGMIKHLWFMGGAVYGGNMTGCAEYNIWKDPVAAHVVITSGISEITMVGLDVTGKAVMKKEDADLLRARGTKRSTAAAELIDFMLERRRRGGEDACIHDALAFLAAVEPSCLKFKKFAVDVEYKGAYANGFTYVDLLEETGMEKNVTVAIWVDTEAFRGHLCDAILRGD